MLKFRLAVTILFFATQPGCMTIVNQIGFWTDSSVGHMTHEDEVVYGGTRTCIRALSNILTVPDPPEQSTGDVFGEVVAGVLFFIDTPLCLIADTLLLPLTLSEAWWLATYAPGR